MSFIKPLLPQRRVDQVIKNFLINSHGRSHATLNLCGGSCVQLLIYRSKVTAYLNDAQKVYPLGFYYSEDLETDPEINYQMPPAPFYTYDEIIQRGEEVQRYGRVISDDPIGEINVKDSKCVNGKLVPNDFYKDYPIQPPSISIVDPFRFKSLADSVRESLNCLL